VKLSAVILAAGRGTRMRSTIPKVLHRAAGRPLIDLVLEQAFSLVPAEEVVVVVGHGADEVRTHLRKVAPAVRTVLQEPQLGTGDALRVAMEALPSGAEAVLVLSGDVPLLRPATLEAMHSALAEGAEAVLLTARLHEPGTYGRILRNRKGGVEAIVEARDADAEILAIREVNAGIYLFRTPSLRKALGELRPDNAQAEYYLTDVVAALRKRSLPIEAVLLDRAVEMLGVNTRAGLARVSRVLVKREMARLMDAGVSIVHPGTTWIEPGSSIGTDTVIEPGVIVRNCSRIGAGARIGAFSLLDGAEVEPGEELPPHSTRLSPESRNG